LHEESKDEFYKVLKNEELKSAIILFFANKQDLPNEKKRNGIYSVLWI